MPLVCFIVWAPYWCPDLWRRHFLWHSSDCCDPGERWHFFLYTVASPPKESVQFICLSKTGSKHVAWTRAHSSFTFASYMSRHRPMSPVLEPFSHKGATPRWCAGVTEGQFLVVTWPAPGVSSRTCFSWGDFHMYIFQCCSYVIFE